MSTDHAELVFVGMRSGELRRGGLIPALRGAGKALLAVLRRFVARFLRRRTRATR